MIYIVDSRAILLIFCITHVGYLKPFNILDVIIFPWAKTEKKQ